MQGNNTSESISSLTSKFLDLLGIRLVSVTEGQAVMEMTIEPKHLNRSGYLHGGVLATLVDNAGGLAGCYNSDKSSVRRAVTVSLTTSFIAPISCGVVRAIAKKRSAGGNIFVSTVEVFNSTDQLLALGEGSYKFVTHNSSDTLHI